MAYRLSIAIGIATKCLLEASTRVYVTSSQACPEGSGPPSKQLKPRTQCLSEAAAAVGARRRGARERGRKGGAKLGWGLNWGGDTSYYYTKPKNLTQKPIRLDKNQNH